MNIDIDKLLENAPSNNIELLDFLAKNIENYVKEVEENGPGTTDEEDLIFLAILSRVYTLIYPEDTISGESNYNKMINLLSKIKENRYTRKIEALVRRNGSIESGIGFAELTVDEKKRSREIIVELRKLIDQAEIKENKKRKIIEKINALANELEKPGVFTDVVASVATDIGFAVGGFTNAASPAFERAQELLRIVYKARARSENPALLESDNFPLLEHDEANHPSSRKASK